MPSAGVRFGQALARFASCGIRGAVPAAICGTCSRISSTCASSSLSYSVVAVSSGATSTSRRPMIGPESALGSTISKRVTPVRASPVRIVQGIAARPRWRGSSVGCIPNMPCGATSSSSPRMSCDQPTTKIASGAASRTAAIVCGEFTSSVSITGTPRSSNEHWPERFGSIGPGRVTTAATSAPASAHASRQRRPITSKLTQTVRTAQLSATGRSSGSGSSGPSSDAVRQTSDQKRVITTPGRNSPTRGSGRSPFASAIAYSG